MPEPSVSDIPVAAWNRSWGTVGLGGTAGLIAGGGGGWARMINLGDGGLETNAFILTGRLGVWAGWEACLQVVLATGARTAAELNGYSDSGVGFQLDIGGRFGSTARLGSRLLGKLDEILAMLNRARPLTAYADANDKTQGFLKEVMMLLVGTRGQIDLSQKATYIIGLPLGAGVGAGVYYEWSVLYTIGTDHRAWNHAQPEWRLMPDGQGQLRLEMRDMPVPDGVGLWLEFREDRLFGSAPALFRSGRLTSGGMYMFRAVSRLGRAQSSMAAGTGADTNVCLVGLPQNVGQGAPYRSGVGGIGNLPHNRWGRTFQVFVRVHSTRGTSDSPGDQVWQSRRSVEVIADRDGRLRPASMAWVR